MAFSWPFNLHLYDFDSTGDDCNLPIKLPYPGGWPDDPAVVKRKKEEKKK